MQVVLQAPEGYAVGQETLQLAASILENRSNALGVSEVLFQVAGEKFIVGEFPGLTNTDEVIKVIKQTGMLEFVDTGDEAPEPGTVIQTDFGNTQNSSQTDAEGSLTDKVYKTIITGADLDRVSIAAPQNPSDGYSIVFTLRQMARKHSVNIQRQILERQFPLCSIKKLSLRQSFEVLSKLVKVQYLEPTPISLPTMKRTIYV